MAHWLQQQGWQIIAHRWRCPQGEVDLIAQFIKPHPSPHSTLNSIPNPTPNPSLEDIPEPHTIAFVEVKTRSPRNWDLDGLLSITAAKQTKIHNAAQVFLAHHGETYPQSLQAPCRFDVALVTLHQKPTPYPTPEPNWSQLLHQPPSTPILWQQPITYGSQSFSLLTYLPHAFDGVS